MIEDETDDGCRCCGMSGLGCCACCISLLGFCSITPLISGGLAAKYKTKPPAACQVYCKSCYCASLCNFATSLNCKRPTYAKDLNLRSNSIWLNVFYCFVAPVTFIRRKLRLKSKAGCLPASALSSSRTRISIDLSSKKRRSVLAMVPWSLYE